MKSYLHRISNTLLINGGFLSNSGLYTGDMGIVLFFYLYARFTQHEIYSEYGSGLLKKTQHKINRSTPLNYKQGLAGTGSCIEYLAQNGFIETNTDDILEDFDKRIFFTYNLPCLPVDQIADIGYYALWRMAGNSVRTDTIIQSVMPQIVHAMEDRQKNKNMTHPIVSFFRDIMMSDNHHTSIISNWHQVCRTNNPFGRPQGYAPTESLSTFDLGIQNGLAGLGLSLLSDLDGDDSWLALFPEDIFSKTDNDPSLQV